MHIVTHDRGVCHDLFCCDEKILKKYQKSVDMILHTGVYWNHRKEDKRMMLKKYLTVEEMEEVKFINTPELVKELCKNVICRSNTKRNYEEEINYIKKLYIDFREENNYSWREYEFVELYYQAKVSLYLTRE